MIILPPKVECVVMSVHLRVVAMWLADWKVDVIMTENPVALLAGLREETS
ncbi:MAG: hypothetical protein ACO398_09180 [Kiritimatiellia bacterium]